MTDRDLLPAPLPAQTVPRFPSWFPVPSFETDCLIGCWTTLPHRPGSGRSHWPPVLVCPPVLPFPTMALYSSFPLPCLGAPCLRHFVHSVNFPSLLGQELQAPCPQTDSLVYYWFPCPLAVLALAIAPFYPMEVAWGRPELTGSWPDRQTPPSPTMPYRRNLV